METSALGIGHRSMPKFEWQVSAIFQTYFGSKLKVSFGREPPEGILAPWPASFQGVNRAIAQAYSVLLDGQNFE